MKALIQRVSSASVIVNQETIGSIERGLLCLIGIAKTDSQDHITRCLNKILKLRVFADSDDKMNLNCQDIQGGILLVPQFTLLADTRSGHRPSFTPAAHPDLSRPLFETMVSQAKQLYPNVASGKFGADMQIHLVNDGPVTLSLDIE